MHKTHGGGIFPLLFGGIMNNLKEKYEIANINGKEYKLLLNIEAVYDIEDALKIPFFEAVKNLSLMSKEAAKTILTFLTCMINANNKEKVTIKDFSNDSAEQIMVYSLIVLQMIKQNIHVDKTEEDDGVDYAEEEVTEHGIYDYPERMFTIGHLLGYKDDEIWKSTPRKLSALHIDYNKYVTGDKPRVEAADVLLGGM